jgi:uncharacterized membrane protein YphA (DoxX/SURF4 family)
MRFLTAVQERICRNRCSAIGLGLFRIAYGSVLLGEVLQLIYFRRLVFGDLMFLPVGESSFAYVLWAWAAATVCLIVGLHTRMACVVNYVLTIATLSTFQHYEYHADHIYISLNLLLLFTPVEKRLSLDSLLGRVRSAALPGSPLPDTTVARFHCDSLLLVGLALVYFDSFVWKLDQHIWNNGLGIWLPASLPHNTWFSTTALNSILNRRVLVSLLSDLTLLFEGTFILLMWVRAARPILFVIGLGLHLSIVFAFPIPFFGLSLAAVYFLLAPEKWYDAIGRRLRLSESRAVVYFDADSPRWRRVLLAVEHFDVRGCLAFRPVRDGGMAAHLTGGLLVVHGNRQYRSLDGLVAALRCHTVLFPFAFPLMIAQRFGARSIGESHPEFTTAQTPRARDWARRITSAADADSSSIGSIVRPMNGAATIASPDATLRIKLAIVVICVLLQATLIPKAGYLTDPSSPSAPPAWLTRVHKLAHGLTGVCSHSVFLDGHFANYDHIVAVTLIRPDGSETWLPLTRPTGQMGWYATGRIWAKWAFRGNAQYMSIEQLKLALRDLTGFWARKNDVDLADARFKVLVKKYDEHEGWQLDYLQRQADKPWAMAGTIHWKGGTFSADIINIEAL